MSGLPEFVIPVDPSNFPEDPNIPAIKRLLSSDLKKRESYLIDREYLYLPIGCPPDLSYPSVPLLVLFFGNNRKIFYLGTACFFNLDSILSVTQNRQLKKWLLREFL